MTEFSLSDDLALALAIAGEADLISIDRYRAQDLDVQLKPDRSQVTDADKRVEKIVRERLSSSRPETRSSARSSARPESPPAPGSSTRSTEPPISCAGSPTGASCSLSWSTAHRSSGS